MMENSGFSLEDKAMFDLLRKNNGVRRNQPEQLLSEDDDETLDYLIVELQHLCDEARGLSRNIPSWYIKVKVMKAGLADLNGIMESHVDGWENDV